MCVHHYIPHRLHVGQLLPRQRNLMHCLSFGLLLCFHLLPAFLLRRWQLLQRLRHRLCFVPRRVRVPLPRTTTIRVWPGHIRVHYRANELQRVPRWLRVRLHHLPSRRVWTGACIIICLCFCSVQACVFCSFARKLLSVMC